MNTETRFFEARCLAVQEGLIVKNSGMWAQIKDEFSYVYFYELLGKEILRILYESLN